MNRGKTDRGKTDRSKTDRGETNGGKTAEAKSEATGTGEAKREAKKRGNVHGSAGIVLGENELRICTAIRRTPPPHRPRTHIHTRLLQSISCLGRMRLEPPNSNIHIYLLSNAYYTK